MCFSKTPSEVAQGTDVASTENLSSIMRTHYLSRFQDQSDVLSYLRNLYTPIASAGPGQFGMTPAEEAARRTEATEVTGREFAKAQRSVGNLLAARGGGADAGLTPYGGEEMLRSAFGTEAAAESARAQRGITAEGYGLGRQQYREATAGLERLSQGYAPAEFGREAQAGFGQSFDERKQLAQQERARQQAGLGMATSLLGVGASFLTGGLSNLGAGESFGEGVGDFFKGGLGAVTGQG